MSYTELKYGKEARQSLLTGAGIVYKAVSPTLSARGRNTVRQKFGQPKLSNDGDNTAKAIEPRDPFEKQGADLLKQAVRESNKEGGDGSTTTTIVGYEMFRGGLELVDGGMNPMILKKRVEEEIIAIQNRLKDMAIPITTDEDLYNIANISVENPVYGKIVAEAVRSSGKDGIVIVQEDAVPGIRKEEVSGYRFDRGWESPYLVTNADKMEAVLEGKEGSPLYVLVADKSWNLIGDLMPMFDEVKKSGCDKLLIIAEEISGELMQFIVLNRMKLKFHAVVVKCPFNKDMLEDIATLTGATAVTSAKGIVNARLVHLGTAAKIIVTETSTTIIGGGGTEVDAKVESLRAQILSADEGYEKDKLQDRLAKITGKTVLLKVGAVTEAEAKYLKDKLDDAVNATKAADDSGILPGGGMALFRLAQELYPLEVKPWFEKSWIWVKSLFGVKEALDFNTFMHDVLCSPLLKILENSGENDKAKVLSRLLNEGNSGYDALRGEVVPDIIKAGIVDPHKVTHCALKYGSSFAAMLLTVETVIADIDEVDNSK